MRLFRPCAALVALGAAWAAPALAQAPTSLRVAGHFSANTHHIAVERPFYEGLPQTLAMPSLAVSFSPMDQVGVQAADALRLLRSGAFDMMSVTIGNVARDEPFFDGLDLIGVSTTLPELRAAVNAGRESFDQRLQSRFGAKVMTLWPFGQQVFFCNHPVNSMADLRGLKIRSYTPSMSALITSLGGTPVTLQFSEVYPALQRGVVTCGITSPTSAHVANWAEVTTHILPLSLAGGVQGHFMSLATWRRFTPEQQAALTRAFQGMEDQFWELARVNNEVALNCMSGRPECTATPRGNVTIATVTPADEARLREIVPQAVLPAFRDTCNRVWNQCSTTWNQTVGAARGYAIP